MHIYNYVTSYTIIILNELKQVSLLQFKRAWMKLGGDYSHFYRNMLGVRPKVSKWCKTTYTYLLYYIFYSSGKKYFITICSCSLEIVWCTVTHSSSIYNEFRGVISLLCICKKTNFLLPLSSFSFLHNFFEQKNGKKIRLRVISSYCNSMVQ